MAYCVKCGAKVDDGIRICPECGGEIPYTGQENDGGYAGGAGQYQSYQYQNQDYTQGQTYQNGSNSYQSGGYQSGSNSYQNGEYQSGTYQENVYQGNTYQNSEYQSNGYQGSIYPEKEYFDSEDVRRNKAMGVLSYFGILVLIPLLAGDRRSEYVKFHLNQGFALFIISKIIDLISGNWVWGLHSLLHFSGNWFSGLFDILDLACFILMVVGIVTACRGERKEIPFLGQIKIWK